MLSVGDNTTDAIGVPQTFGSFTHQTFLKQLSDMRRAYRTLSRKCSDLYTQFVTIAHIVVKTFVPVVPKAVVVASQQHLDMQLF